MQVGVCALVWSQRIQQQIETAKEMWGLYSNIKA